MGNCQASNAAALVIQHPNGRLERLYWPVSVSEVIRMNPGHYVFLIIPLPMPESSDKDDQGVKTVKFTRVKLLRSTDTLVLGHAYRLLTSQEVMKVMKAKKSAKLKKQQLESVEKSEKLPEKQSSGGRRGRKSDNEESNQVMKHERDGQRTTSTNSMATRSKSWRPSLQSISEAGS